MYTFLEQGDYNHPGNHDNTADQSFSDMSFFKQEGAIRDTKKQTHTFYRNDVGDFYDIHRQKMGNCGTSHSESNQTEYCSVRS